MRITINDKDLNNLYILHNVSKCKICCSREVLIYTKDRQLIRTIKDDRIKSIFIENDKFDDKRFIFVTDFFNRKYKTKSLIIDDIDDIISVRVYERHCKD